MLQPVWPHVLNFVDRGLLIRSVVLAVEVPGADSGATERPIVCLLDLRPILLGFVVASAPGGLYDVDGLSARLGGFCPPGFRVHVTGGHRRATDERVVFAGETLVVSFVAAGSYPVELPTDPAYSGPTVPPTDDASPPDPPSGSATSQGRLQPPSSHNGLPAGTGSASGRTRSHNTARAVSPCATGFKPPLLAVCLLALCRPLTAMPSTVETDVGLRIACPDVIAGGTRSVLPDSDADQLYKPEVAHVWAHRPVATPCRSTAHPISDDYLWHLGVLDTLLDESAATCDQWAFLAATLLDTLWEHLYDNDDYMPCLTSNGQPYGHYSVVAFSAFEPVTPSLYASCKSRTGG